jgi:D-beta-D-heptose 7-phosphate kinase/D-beta-D-heptose 1-phosphate adenosyltransferase
VTCLLTALDRLAAPPLLVLGDLMLDRFTEGAAARISPEAPVLVLDTEQSRPGLGGAAAVASLLRALDVPVRLAGVIGPDLPGFHLSAPRPRERPEV